MIERSGIISVLVLASLPITTILWNQGLNFVLLAIREAFKRLKIGEGLDWLGCGQAKIMAQGFVHSQPLALLAGVFGDRVESKMLGVLFLHLAALFENSDKSFKVARPQIPDRSLFGLLNGLLGIFLLFRLQNIGLQQ